MSAFDDALALVLKMEGGRVDNPADPGGRTAFGVTQNTYDAWRARQSLGTRDVYLIDPAEVAAIYRTEYADKIKFDELPPGVGYCVFDAAVNSGPSRAAKWLQSTLRITEDGVIGPETIAAAKDAKQAALVSMYCDKRLGFLMGLSTWATFGKGWSNRVSFVRAHAMPMVPLPTPSVAPVVVPATPPVAPVAPPVPPVVPAVPKLVPRVEPVTPPVLPKIDLPPVQPSFWSRLWTLFHKH